jgi:large subunit ribosomal protein L29
MASILRAHELDEMNETDLEARLREAKEELFNLRFQAATGQLESHGRLRTVKKDIARIYTVVRERELGIRTTPGVEDDEKPQKAQKAPKAKKEGADA